MWQEFASLLDPHISTHFLFKSFILVALVRGGLDKKTVIEEHVLIQEPGTIYGGHVTHNI